MLILFLGGLLSCAISSRRSIGPGAPDSALCSIGAWFSQKYCFVDCCYVPKYNIFCKCCCLFVGAALSLVWSFRHSPLLLQGCGPCPKNIFLACCCGGLFNCTQWSRGPRCCIMPGAPGLPLCFLSAQLTNHCC